MQQRFVRTCEVSYIVIKFSAIILLSAWSQLTPSMVREDRYSQPFVLKVLFSGKQKMAFAILQFLIALQISSFQHSYASHRREKHFSICIKTVCVKNRSKNDQNWTKHPTPEHLKAVLLNELKLFTLQLSLNRRIMGTGTLSYLFFLIKWWLGI